jgi:hypothetical protein
MWSLGLFIYTEHIAMIMKGIKRISMSEVLSYPGNKRMMIVALLFSIKLRSQQLALSLSARLVIAVAYENIELLRS